MRTWKNISDEDLDLAFREAADANLPEYDQASWEKMEVLLDRTEQEEAGFFNWKKIVLFTGLFILLGGIGYWFGGRFSAVQPSESSGIHAEQNKEPKEQLEENREPKEQLEEKSEPREQMVENSQSLLSEKNRMKEQMDEQKSRKDEPVTGISERKSNRRSDNPRNFDSQIKENQRGMTKSGGWNQRELKESPKIIQPGLSENEGAFLEGTTVVHADEKSKITPETLESLSSKIIDTDNFYETEVLSPRKISTTKPLLKGKGLGFRLIFSPDFSFVPDYGMFKMGHNLGGMLEYRMNSRWSVQAGVLKSQKYYLTDPDQYPWPERWGERPSQLNRIDASCNMMDFPVNVRYNFTQGRSNLFGQVGLTSYLMIKEKYDYVYESSYTTNVYMSWEGRTGFYSLGELNLSGGLEMQLNRNLNVQFEPFLKVPLQRVGYGSVKVGTFGMFISTRIPVGSKE